MIVLFGHNMRIQGSLTLLMDCVEHPSLTLYENDKHPLYGGAYRLRSLFG